MQDTTLDFLDKFNITKSMVLVKEHDLLRGIDTGMQHIAAGYITKYIKEKLDCKIWIVEYEQAAFDIAKQYAEDGICADIMDDNWVNKFQNMKFDYILFADVLEHLYNLQKVMKQAIELLKYDEKI